MIGAQKPSGPNYEELKKQAESGRGWGETLKDLARHSLSNLRENGAQSFVNRWLLPLAEDAFPPDAGGMVSSKRLPYFQMLCALTAYLEAAASTRARWTHPYLPPLSVTKNLFGGTAYVTDEAGNNLTILSDPIGADPAAVISEVRDRFLSARTDLYWPQHQDQPFAERFETTLTEPQRVVSRERFKKNLDTACAAVRAGHCDKLVMMTDRAPVPEAKGSPMFPLFLAGVFFDGNLPASAFEMTLAAKAADCLSPYATGSEESPFLFPPEKVPLNKLAPKLREMLSAAVIIGRKVPLETAVKMHADLVFSLLCQVNSYFDSVGAEIAGKGDIGLHAGNVELFDALCQITGVSSAHPLSFSPSIFGLVSHRRIKDSGICPADWDPTVWEAVALRRLLSNEDISNVMVQVKTVLQTRRADTGAALPDFAAEACMPDGGIPSPVPGFYCRLSEIADIRVNRGVPFDTYYEDPGESLSLRQESAQKGLTVRFSVHEGKEKYAVALCLYHYALSNGLDVFNTAERPSVITCGARETFGCSMPELDALFEDKAIVGWLQGEYPLRRIAEASIPSLSQGKISFDPSARDAVGARIRPEVLSRLYAFQEDIFRQDGKAAYHLPPLPEARSAPGVPDPDGMEAVTDGEDTRRFAGQQSDLALKVLLGTNPYPARPDGSADMPIDLRHRGALRKLDALSLHVHGSRLLGGPAPTILLAHGCIRMPVCPNTLPPAGGCWKYPPPGVPCILDEGKMETAYLVLRDLLHHKITAFPERKEAGAVYPYRYGFVEKSKLSEHPMISLFELNQGVPLTTGRDRGQTVEIQAWETALEKLRMTEEIFKDIADMFGYERLSEAVRETNLLLSDAEHFTAHVLIGKSKTQGVPLKGAFFPVPTAEDVELSASADGVAQIRQRIGDGHIIRTWGGSKIREAATTLRLALDAGCDKNFSETTF